MGAFVAFIMAALTIFGSNNMVQREQIKEDKAYFDSILPTFSCEQKKDAIRVYFVQTEQYKRIEEIPSLNKQQVNELFIEANFYFDRES